LCANETITNNMMSITSIKMLILILVTCLLISALSGCQTTPQTTELASIPTETSIPPSVTPLPKIISTNTLIPPTPTEVPTETSIPLTPTITALPEQRVTSVDQLIGVWKGKWDTNYLEQYKSDGEAVLIFEQYRETAEKELFTFEDGLLKWGEIAFTIGEPQECLDDPAASYEVYITDQGDQPVSLRWVLVGEEHCQPRYKFLTLFPYT